MTAGNYAHSSWNIKYYDVTVDHIFHFSYLGQQFDSSLCGRV